MCIHYVVLILMVLFGGSIATAQKQNNVWYFGSGVGLDFNGTPPSVLHDGAMGLSSGQRFEYEGCASVSDRRTGALLFYTDGISVWNRSHTLMPNGRGLLGRHHSTNSAMIVPMPGDDQRYYIFTADAGFGRDSTPDGPNSGINYSIVDMRLDGGRGNIVEKNHRLLNRATEKLCVIPQPRCGSYWVITQGWWEKKYYAFLVTANGVSSPVISEVGTPDAVFLTNGTGCLKASHDRKSIVSVIDALHMAELFAFDENTGTLSNPIPLKLSQSSHPYGACFSPDNSRLYISSFEGVSQYSVTSMDSVTITNSVTTITKSTALPVRALELGPDGKIYGAVNEGASLVRIDSPNAQGDLCSFTRQAVNLSPGTCSNGLPSIVPFVTATGTPPSGSAGNDAVICSGDTAQLNGSGGAFYRWSPADGLSCTACSSPRSFPKTTTTYHLFISDAAGCSTSDSVVVTVNPLPVASAGRDTAICAGGEVTLHASGGGSYRWSPATGLSCTNCPDPIARPQATSTYMVTVTNDAGCSSSDSVIVRVLDPESVDAGADTSICQGETVQLQAPDGAAWQWSPPDGLTCTDCRAPMASPATTTTYTVVITNAGGCSARDSVTVALFPQPDIDAGDDVAVCPGGSTTLSVRGGVDYRWSPPAGLNCTNCPNPVATPATTTTYHVTATDEHGCTGSDSVTVTIIDVKNVDAGVAQPICSGDSVQLQASDGAAWLWSPAAGLSCTDCRSPKTSPSSTTLYTVTVGAAGCSASDTVTVIVLAAPVISAGGDVSVCPGGTVQLHATGGTTYQWSPAEGLSCIDCVDPIASPSATTHYHVVATSANGCRGEDDVRVEVSTTQVVRGHLGREYHAFPAAPLRIPVILDDAITTPGIDTMEIDLSYGVDILRMNGVDLADGLLNGWKLEPLNVTLGNYRARVIAPVGVVAQGSGTLLTLEMAAFLGDSLASELPVHVELVGSKCQRIEIAPGRVALDSVCGMMLRIVRISADKYSLSQNDPNPFNPTTRIAFSLAFDGPARLEVFDAAGTRVAVLVEDAMAAGSYEAVWDAGNVASGVYYYRLTSGTWSAARRMVVVK